MWRWIQRPTSVAAGRCEAVADRPVQARVGLGSKLGLISGYCTERRARKERLA